MYRWGPVSGFVGSGKLLAKKSSSKSKTMATVSYCSGSRLREANPRPIELFHGSRRRPASNVANVDVANN